MDDLSPIGLKLLELPTGYNGRAIANHQKQQPNSKARASSSLASTIDMAFTWAKTPEGEKFWNKVYACADRGRDVSEYPPLPDT